MSKKSNAVAEELRELGQDLRTLVVTLTTDQKAQASRERRWRILYGATSALFALGARRLATKGWTILTGEEPPLRRQAPQQARESAPERQRSREEPEPAAERASSSS